MKSDVVCFVLKKKEWNDFGVSKRKKWLTENDSSQQNGEDEGGKVVMQIKGPLHEEKGDVVERPAQEEEQPRALKSFS